MAASSWPTCRLRRERPKTAARRCRRKPRGLGGWAAGLEEGAAASQQAFRRAEADELLADAASSLLRQSAYMLKRKSAEAPILAPRVREGRRKPLRIEVVQHLDVEANLQHQPVVRARAAFDDERGEGRHHDLHVGVAVGPRRKHRLRARKRRNTCSNATASAAGI
eukprot:4667844-Pleurochrysis_carterae.AAC.1